MAGTKAGGAKAAATNKDRYGADYYRRIGSEGGKNGHTGGFYADRERARIAGAKGGRLSKRPFSDGSKRPLTIGELTDADNAYKKAIKQLQRVHDEASVQG